MPNARAKLFGRRLIYRPVHIPCLAALMLTLNCGYSAKHIDRHALVTRHNPVLRALDVDAPLTVGNGQFAFTADITGLQTFPALYHKQGIPTETQARWCWVSDANTNEFSLRDASREFRHADGRIISYPTIASNPAGDWLRKNPRIHPLGVLGLVCRKQDGSELTPEDIRNPSQTLDFWHGMISSRYELEGQTVEVKTVCHPKLDMVAVRIESELLSSGSLEVALRFPRGYDLAIKNTPPFDWSKPESHRSLIRRQNSRELQVERQVGTTVYWTKLHWQGEAEVRQSGSHEFRLRSRNEARALEFCLWFGSESQRKLPMPGYQAAVKASAAHWEDFWEGIAAVDFTGSTDPRAAQLEQRVILSQYLMAVQMAAGIPPQESGLTCATWYGKHHTEMIWWHTAHFALWGNDESLKNNLRWYQAQLPAARELAGSRGLRGARWAKMTGPEMRESPGGNPLIVWNQPHMIYLCELLYRNAPTRRVLREYRELVLETADCMASMLHFDAERGNYVLGPPLWIAQEIYDPALSQNPSFELAYWRWGLATAQQWRERLRLARNPQWDHCLRHLSPIPEKAGKYVALGSHPDTFENVEHRHDHPTMLAPLGFLPGGDVDRSTMERTLDAVLESWDWETKIWGWDYPMIAMTAARLGRAETAVEILLRNGPNNIYMPNGHCPQRSDEAAVRSDKPGARKREIAAYLPANGAFLSAVALMAAGWDGNTNQAPGFPKDGTWKVRVEGLNKLP